MTNSRRCAEQASRADGAREQILDSTEPSAFLRLAGTNQEWLVVCDHASNRMPRSLRSLGLSGDELELHIAWDIGALQIATRLASRLRAPLIASGYSRLVLDCNRYPDASDSIPQMSDHHRISGNLELSEAARKLRRAEFFRPYHRAIGAALQEAEDGGRTPAFISIHTCAASMHGKLRPWDIGIGWSRDARISAPLIKNLRGQPGVTVGDNLPYALEVGADFTTPEHAMARGLAHVQIEFRQDLVAGPDEATRWADLLHDALLAVESKASWHRREYYLEPADNIRGADAWL